DNNRCESDKVAITVGLSPRPSVSASGYSCTDGSAHIQAASSSEVSYYYLYKRVNNNYDYIASSSAGNFTVNDFYQSQGNSSLQASDYYVRGVRSGCYSNYSNVYLHVFRPDMPDTSGNLNICSGVVNEIPDLTLSSGFGIEIIDLSGVFNNKDEKVLTLTTTSSNKGIVTVSISDNKLTLTEVGPGITEITVTASDRSGGMASDVFKVEVLAPVVGIDDRESTAVRLFPNPSDGLMVMHSSLFSKGKVDIQLFDMANRRIIPSFRRIDESSYELDLADNAFGLYFIQIKIGDGPVIKKRLIIK
ncbi:T9SS type A sorting domain-containing protein, partial [Fulvivirgaceae bacterium BMA12]|nr:T9SS type A sorting domain-containing protein [Fulvivirgaceae bacterium BMA12]